MYLFSSFGGGRVLEKVWRLGLLFGIGIGDCESEGVVGVAGRSSNGNSFDGFAFWRANLWRRRGGGAAALWGAMTDIFVFLVAIAFWDVSILPIGRANVVAS